MINNNWGVAKLVKAADFDSAIRGFESFLPSQHLPWARMSDDGKLGNEHGAA